MAEGLNRVMLLGNLGADPELRTTQGGTAVLKLRLATTERYLDANKAWQERTEWHSVVVWGKRGEALHRFLTKGSNIFVEGSLRTSSYEDREGVKRYKTEVVASNVLLTGGRGGGQRASADDYEGGGAPPPRSAAPRGAGGGAPGGGGRAPAPAPADDGPPEDFGYGPGGGDDDIPF